MTNGAIFEVAKATQTGEFKKLEAGHVVLFEKTPIYIDNSEVMAPLFHVAIGNRQTTQFGLWILRQTPPPIW